MSAQAKSGNGTDPALLRIRGLWIRFGGLVALADVSFDVQRGHIHGLIGPNGAGKTTLFNCVSRLYDPTQGDIELEGRSITSLRAHAIAPLGIGRTFQNLALFPTMTVLSNVLVGGHCRTRGNFVSCALKLPLARREDRRLRERVTHILDMLNLTTVANSPVGSLPYATRKRVELARALAGEPKLLLLDEPASGLNHEEVERLTDLLRTVRARANLTILLVEHHLNLVMRVSDRVAVLDFGRLIAQGTPAEMQSHPEVIRAYLGAPA
jgi:branched-chain amino acid transport system ATP-binding protein